MLFDRLRLSFVTKYFERIDLVKREQEQVVVSQPPNEPQQIYIIKLSGKIADSPDKLINLSEEIALLARMNIKVILVHGGGVQLDRFADRMSVPQTKVNGRRVTNEATMEIAQMVFAKINAEICSSLRGMGVESVGVSGADSSLILAERRPPVLIKCNDKGTEDWIDFGLVGDVIKCDPSLLVTLIDQGYVPVISSFGTDVSGSILNVNADVVASVLAKNLKVKKIVYMTDVNGVFYNISNPCSRIKKLSSKNAAELIQRGVIKGGMIPKVESILNLLKSGVESAHIIGDAETNYPITQIMENQDIGTVFFSEVMTNGDRI